MSNTQCTDWICPGPLLSVEGIEWHKEDFSDAHHESGGNLARIID